MKGINQNLLIVILIAGIIIAIKNNFFIALGFGVIGLGLTILSIICLKKIKPNEEKFNRCVIISLIKSFIVIGFVVSFAINILSR